jgi:FkbM family methyltransferase
MAASFVQWVDRQSWIHTLVKMLRVRDLASWFLRLRPMTRSFSSGTVVEVSGLESLFLCDEIFQRETYKKALSLSGEVKTVADLGCNTGFFCCYLRHYFGRTDFHGIGIDANPAILKDAARNLELNQLTDIRLLNGLVGGAPGTSQKFYIYASHLGSSQFHQAEAGRLPKGGWKEIEVPVLTVSEIWKASHGEAPIDLLKVDIEGSEGRLLLADPALFQQARCVVLEWHKWLVKEEELFPALHRLGFLHQEALEKGDTTELWFFSRQS